MRVHIYDTTLRDGEQAPGFSMNSDEKLELALQLQRLGVDTIEAGFAASSPEDAASVAAIARAVRGCGVASLARAVEKDIDAAWQAVKAAEAPRIHVFLATSPLHMEYKLKMSPSQVLDTVTRAVAYAAKLCGDVQFSAEDATRSDRDFLSKVFAAAQAAGARTLNIPDTVGYATPEEMTALVRFIGDRLPDREGVTLAVHCHNDLGMATANTLAGLAAGARQAECTLCGIGERAGNAALEEIVMALATRRDSLNAQTNIDTRQIYRSTRLLAASTGHVPAANKPIVGANAFLHEAGIHQHGVMAHRGTYEIMDPADLGVPQQQMVLGKHSGRHALAERLEQLGYKLPTDTLDTVFAAFKRLADKKKSISDRDLEALVSQSEHARQGRYALEHFVVNSGSSIDGMAVIQLRDGDQLIKRVAMGDGPIDAAFQAINAIVGVDYTLESYALNALTGDSDAQGEAVVRLRHNDRVVTGRGVSTDVMAATLNAYLQAVNRLQQV